MAIESRLAEIISRPLGAGSHESIEHGMCVMEAVSYVAGEPWSDSPSCACPVIGAFMRAWNDGLPSDADRDRLLRPLIPQLVGTRSTKEVEERRAFLAMDWSIRVFTPAWLDNVDALKPHAAALRNLDEIADAAGLVAARAALSAVAAAARDLASASAWNAAGNAARAAAWNAAGNAAWNATGDAAWAAARAAAGASAGAAARDAAWAAARVAAWDAAWAAARAAAWNAAGNAARDAAWAAAWAAAWNAAGNATRDAAWDAARDAVWDAAWDAAAAALRPTTERLQESALDLVVRMIAADAGYAPR